jgi:hypothetical protein
MLVEVELAQPAALDGSLAVGLRRSFLVIKVPEMLVRTLRCYLRFPLFISRCPAHSSESAGRPSLWSG